MSWHDVWVIGHVTRDRNVSRAGVEERAGGTATYFALALAGLGRDVAVLTRIAPSDEAELLAEHRRASVEVACAPSAKTTEFENRYDERDPDRRLQRVGAVALPFVPADLGSARADLFHLGPLTAEDFGLDFLRAVAERGRVSLDAQGLVRRISQGRVALSDWPEKREGLAHVDFLKADDAEAAVLTGETDPVLAAETLASWGPREVLVTLASRGSWVLHEGGLERIPAVPIPDAVDPTGCGDTYMAAYLNERLAGRSVRRAAAFASAAAALVARRAGPFRENRSAVEALFESTGGLSSPPGA